MTTTDDAAVTAGLVRLGLLDTPTSRAVLVLLDQTVSRLHRSGRILGAWIGRREYVSNLPDSLLDAFEVSTEYNVTDLVAPEVRPGLLATIEACLATGEPASIDFTTRATGSLLHLQGSCAPCGDDEVIWMTRNVTAEVEARRRAEDRADIEALTGDALQSLIDTDIDTDGGDRGLRAALERIAAHFGAVSAFLHRFHGRTHVEIVAQWRDAGVSDAAPGTSRAGPGTFPWTTRQLFEHPVLVVPAVGLLGPEASVDVGNWGFVDDQGLVWIRLGPATRPTGLMGLEFDVPVRDTDRDRYEPLIGFGDAALAIVEHGIDRKRRALQQDVFELIARGASPSEILVKVCELEEAGSSGIRCVAWLAGDDGRLHPIGTAASAAARAAASDWVDTDGTPEFVAARTGRGGWFRAGEIGAASLGPFAASVGATSVGLIPITTTAGDHTVAVLGVYDVSDVPVTPDMDEHGVPVRLAASLAAMALRRLDDLVQLERRASQDVLTGLANRATLLARLEAALADSSPVDRLVAVLYCDIDRFKELNDRLGHARGDQFLIDIAKLITEQVPPGALVSRVGGDEFVILLTELGDEEDAHLVAERIRTAVRVSSVLPRRPATISIGVAVSGSSGEHAEGLLRDADIAMYRAKASGRNRVEVFAEQIRREARERDRLAEDLARALENGDLGVHYQPMVNLVTGRIAGFEALARWEHPERGFIPPDEFIPIAEASGLIGRLGEMVLDRSLRLATRWGDLDLHVNLSAHQIDTVGGGTALLDRIRASGVPFDRVAMEVTESVLLSASTSTSENLRVLTEAGVGLVLDDFGTGYASLTYLRRFPFKGLKIDRSFVSGVEQSSADAAIVSMVMALATTMGLEVVAEGVETVGQEQVLRQIGCPFVQGFRYSEPVPAEHVAALVETSVLM